MAWSFLAVPLLGYLIGSFPSGIIAGRVARGVDVRQYGSGKTGFANVLRSAGGRAALVTLIADVGKGAAAVLLGELIVGDAVVTLGPIELDSQGAQVIGGLAAIIGHNWSVYINFGGGRGVDTTLGGLLAISPWAGLGCFVLGVGVILIFRYVSLGSMLAALGGVAIMAPLVALDREPAEFMVFVGAGASLIILQHRDNIARLLSGTERKVGQRGEERESQ